MGNISLHQNPANSSSSNKQFLSRINKVSHSQSQQFGNYAIYQLQQKPYSYYLEYIETTIPQSDLLKHKLNFYQNMPRNKNVVPVEYVEIEKRKELCAEFDGLRLFCIYYNFTLEDAIRLKIKQRTTFTEPEILYILKSLLSIGKFYQSQLKSAFYSGIYQTRKVYISPEGHVKIYPFNENIFSAYSDMIFREEEEDLSSEYNVDGKKIETTGRNNKKHLEQSRGDFALSNDLAASKDLGLSKNTSKSQYGARRSKLTTTLSKQYFLSSISSKQSLLNSSPHLQLHTATTINKPKQSFSNKQSLQFSSYLQDNTKPQISQRTNKRDMFELGLLIMQLILLNQSHEYYSGSRSETTMTSSVIGARSRIVSCREKTLTGKTVSPDLACFKYIEEYENDSGKTPNIDLIHFSLTKLLPKKSISKPLLNLIQTLIFPSTATTISQITSQVQHLQQLSTQSKHCIKFEITKDESPNHSDFNASKYMMKNKSTDPFTKTTDLSYAFGQDSANQSKILPKFVLEPAISKESFFTNTNKLDQLLNQKNLASSMIAERIQDGVDSSQILNTLKKSRKLVPTKVRSISTKQPEKPKQIDQPVHTQRYKLNFK